MTWRSEPFRQHDRATIGTVGASNSCVRYRNLVDELVAGLDERVAAPGSKARNECQSLGISQFKSIAERVWPVDAMP